MPLDVPFLTRFTNIMDMTKVEMQSGQDATSAKTSATQNEQSFYLESDTPAEYQKQCDKFIQGGSELATHPTNDDLDLENDDDEVETIQEVEEVFNTDGPKFGKYEWATYHADGVTSTIYKARPIVTASNVEQTSQRKVVALKVVPMDQLQAPHNVRKEVRVLKRAQSDDAHIVPLLDSFQQPGGKLILVFPFLRQDLENLLRSGRLSASQSGMVFRGLFEALTHLHGLGIIHRDIKPGNILLESMDGPVYLIDFGIAWDPEDAESERVDGKITDVGTTCYRAPEVLFGCRDYGVEYDMWAAGCVIAEVVSRDHARLFDGGAVGSELGLIKSVFSTLGTPTDEDWPSATGYPDWGKVRFTDFKAKRWDDILSGTSEAAKDFVSRTVCYEPTKRLSAREALSHALGQEFR